jgi:sulfofructosephosphate aldolase
MSGGATSLGSPLRSWATERGAICMLALDHRDAMRNAFERVGVPDVSETVMLDVKSRITDELIEAASVVLLDSMALERLRPVGLPVVMPLEEQGHQPCAGGRLTQLLDDFTPADAAMLGAQGCKLLLYYRTDHVETAVRQRELVVKVAAECHRHGLPLVVEPLVYRLAGEHRQAYERQFADLVIGAAEDLAASGADLLKLQFPGSAATCQRLTQAAAPLPWTVLGGSDANPAEFSIQLRIACAGGASGFIAGRAIWGGALAQAPEQQRAWLRDRARPLMHRLVEIADTNARRIR